MILKRKVAFTSCLHMPKTFAPISLLLICIPAWACVHTYFAIKSLNGILYCSICYTYCSHTTIFLLFFCSVCSHVRPHAHHMELQCDWVPFACYTTHCSQFRLLRAAFHWSKLVATDACVTGWGVAWCHGGRVVCALLMLY